MRPITFEVLFTDADDCLLEDLGLRPNILTSNTRTVTFYNIDCTFSYYENGTDYCCILSGGDEYIIPKTKDEVDFIMSRHLDKRI